MDFMDQNKVTKMIGMILRDTYGGINILESRSCEICEIKCFCDAVYMC